MSARFKRLDAAEKVNGTGIYADDLFFPGMLYAKAVRSKYPRALVKKSTFQRPKRTRTVCAF